MSRWEPDARGRLEQAALELFGERGFEQATAAGIAARAGLTERTFFRYFTDKREVLFGGAGALQDFFVQQVAAAPDSLPPLEMIVEAVAAAGTFFGPRREFSRLRQSVIAANAELQERELIKLARLSAALAEVLQRRGVGELAAGLAAEAGVAVYKVTFQRWFEADDDRDFADIVRECLAELRAVTAGRSPAVSPPSGTVAGLR